MDKAVRRTRQNCEKYKRYRERIKELESKDSELREGRLKKQRLRY